MALDDFDRQLIAATQGGLPLVPRPYDAVGERLGVSGLQVRERLALTHLLAGDAKLLPHGVVGARHQRQATLSGSDERAVEIVKRHGRLRWSGGA